MNSCKLSEYFKKWKENAAKIAKADKIRHDTNVTPTLVSEHRHFGKRTGSVDVQSHLVNLIAVKASTNNNGYNYY